MVLENAYNKVLESHGKPLSVIYAHPCYVRFFSKMSLINFGEFFLDVVM